MGYRFGDFIDDVVKPVQNVWMAPFQGLLGGVSNIASSMSAPLMIGGCAVLAIVLLKK